MSHLHNAIWELKAKLDADWLQVALAPFLHSVLHHVGDHSDEHIQRVQLVPAGTSQMSRKQCGCST